MEGRGPVCPPMERGGEGRGREYLWWIEIEVAFEAGIVHAGDEDAHVALETLGAPVHEGHHTRPTHCPILVVLHQRHLHHRLRGVKLHGENKV